MNSKVLQNDNGDEDSWKTKLSEAGYQVEVQMTGMGELDSIQDIFVEHLEAAMKKEV